MLDTKLKKTHKLAVVLIALSILLPATILVALYPRMEQVYLQQKSELGAVESNTDNSWTDVHLEVHSEYVNYVVEASYYIYGQMLQDEQGEPVDFSVLNEYGWINDYFEITEDSDYFARYTREIGTHEESNSSYSLDLLLNQDDNLFAESVIKEMAKNSYLGYIILKFDEYGNISNVGFQSIEPNEAGNPFIYGNLYEHASESIRQYENNAAYYNNSISTDEVAFEKKSNVDPMELRPKNFEIIFAVHEDSNFVYQDAEDNAFDPLQIYFNMGAEWIVLAAAVFVMLMALILPFFKKLDTGREKIFNWSLEANLCIACLAIGGIILMFEIMVFSSYTVLSEMLTEYGGLKIIGYDITPKMLYNIMLVVNFLGWALCFFMEYIVVAAFRQFLCAPGRYLKERWLIIVFLRWIKRKCVQLYRYVTDIEIGRGMKKSIIKIVLANFAILFLLCCMWVFGVFGLVIYSIGLYVLLAKSGSKMQAQYDDMVYATGQMAEGNLKVELPQDMGIFTDLGTELKKVQDGFSKAVAEEAKSQNMKTELITNVSHDLKTPLTAIITYVDLLKKDDITEAERTEYVETLERKSQRLKVLIEDLFEVSKASTNNITMYYSDVDLVNLLKQVCLENEDKIAESTLDIRWTLPEKKCMAHLDPNRTYRIMDNLLQNTLKYSMPHSRVYVDMEEEETEYVIRFKNMSATEMNFDASEITERFVRGDLSRNTEGSGLGLAIAQSFTELQNGKFIVEIDGDLFKVTIRFPKNEGIV